MNLTEYKDVYVFAEQREGKLQNVALEQPKVVFEMQAYIEKERAKGTGYTSPISK